MIFWTLLILAALIMIWAFTSGFDEDGLGWGLAQAMLAGIISGVVGGLIFLACGFWIPWNHTVVRDDTYKLKAIGNSNAIEGRMYFLGGGYIDDKRVLNFISQRDGGAIHVEQAEAEDATIYEGAQDATVRIKHIDAVNGWVSPWPLGSGDEYEFHIPTGSVVESYTLDNK